MGDEDIFRNPSIEGLRHSRDLMYEQWTKERQRSRNLKKRNEELLLEIESLKKQLNGSGSG